MCSSYIPQPPPPYFGPARRLYTPLAPPKPLPWYIRDPLGSLLASMGAVFALVVFIKAVELVGRL